MILQPPPRPPTISDPVMSNYISSLHRWFNDFYVKMGAANGPAKISVTGTATTVTGDVPATQLSGAVPIANGGTGAATAAAAATNLGVQSAFSAGAAGDVPVSDGVSYSVRRLAYNDIQGVPEIQHQFGVALTPPASAALGDSGDTTITWASAFADGNYSLSAVSHPTTGTPIVTIVSKISSGCTIRVTNATAVQVTGTLDVQGIHS